MGRIINWLLPAGGILEDFLMKKVLGKEKLLNEFEKRTHNFPQVQEETLDKIIEQNEGTKWGRNHKFTKLNHKTWKSVPVVTYEQVKPYVDRIRQGDFRALTNELPEALALTSGTSSTPKFIPLTPSSIKSQQNGADVWNFILKRDHNTLLTQFLILSGGSKRKDTELLPVMSYTDIVKSKQNPLIQRRMVFSRDVECISDFEHRLLIAAQQAFIKQPKALISVNPLSILRLLNLTDENRAEIGRATIKGKYIGTDIEIGKIKKKKKEEILADIMSKNPLDSVKFIGTWLGGTQYLFIDKLRKRGIDVPIRDLGYLATEGRFTIPIKNNTPKGILNPFGNYYEFMTLDKKDFVPIQELKEGREYNFVITGENGLYRYDIQDVVRIEGFYNKTPIISFMRKGEGFSSLTGEKIHENHVVELLKKLNTEGFLVAKIDPPHYLLNLPKDYQGPNAGAVDSMLQEINPEYFQKRENNRLNCLEIKYLNSSEFQELDKKINPNQSHDRFKRKYLVPLEVIN